MRREVIATDRAPRSTMPHAQAIRFGSLVFVAGQVPLDPATGVVVGDDIRQQTRRVLDNIRAILEAAGTDLENSLDSLCILRDMADYDGFNDAYREYFGPNGPARTTVQGRLAREAFRVEIRIIAGIPGAG